MYSFFIIWCIIKVYVISYFLIEVFTMLENSKIVYVAHPYSGLSSNYEKVSDIMNVLCSKFSDKTFISPIHAYGFMYESVDYEKGINLCFKLLDLCDTVLLCGEWEHSKGCNMEKDYALDNNKIVEVL